VEVSVARYLRTPINYAARAKSSDAKLSFAFTLFGLYATNRVTPISYYLPVDPISSPSKVHCSSCLSDEKELTIERLGMVLIPLQCTSGGDDGFAAVSSLVFSLHQHHNTIYTSSIM